MASSTFSLPLRGLPLASKDITEARLWNSSPLSGADLDAPFAIPPLVRAIVPMCCSLAFFVLAIGSLFAANKSTHVDHTYGLLLSAGAAFIASVVYARITSIRDQSRVPESVRSDRAGDLNKSSQWQEMAVDILHHVCWILTSPLIILRLIDLAGGQGDMWENRSWTIAMIISSVVLSLIVRTGTDEMVLSRPSNTWNNTVVLIGALLAAGGITLYSITVVGLLDAAKANPQNKNEVEYFVYLTIGYFALSFVAVVWRNFIGEAFGGKKDYSESLSFLKDFGYAILDFLLIGVLAYGSTVEFFQHGIEKTSFFNATNLAL
jgi:hypothetical protein